MSKQIISLIFLLFIIGIFQVQVCSDDFVSVKQANDSISETVACLRKIKTDGINLATIPSAAKPLLTQLKHQLRDYVQTMLASQSVGQMSTEVLQSEIQTGLKADGIVIGEPDEIEIDKDFNNDVYVYGDIYDILVQQPEAHPDLLAVTTTIGVCCGNDTSFYLFKRENADWRLVLAQEANEYDDVSGAQGRFTYAISPPDKQGKFFVVTANVNPWCTSNWQSLRYQVLRVGQSAYEPQILLSQESIIFLGVDDPVYELKVQRNRFSLKFHDDGFMEKINNGEDIDLDMPEAFRILRYKVTDNRVTRLSK